MTQQNAALIGEANRSQSKTALPKLYQPDWGSLMREAVVSPRLASQPAVDAFMRQSLTWLRGEEPAGSVDPAALRALGLLAGHRQVWQTALASALANAPEDESLLLLQQQLVPILNEVAQTYGVLSQRRPAPPVVSSEDASLALGYFRRESRNGRLVQCRACDPGSMPLFGTPQPIESLQGEPAAKRVSVTGALVKAYRACKQWAIEILHLADSGVAEATKVEKDYKYSS